MKKTILIFLSLILISTLSLGAIIRLTDGTEAKVKVINLTEKRAVVQAEGFNQPVQLEPSEIDYILIDETNEQLKTLAGIVFYN
ncbi:MAG: hypothetical protein ABDH59_05985, partial [Fervidobacterium sp.]